MVDLVFVFNHVNAEKLYSEISSRGKLKCNKYIDFLSKFTIPMEEIWVYEILFSDLVIVKVKVKESIPITKQRTEVKVIVKQDMLRSC